MSFLLMLTFAVTTNIAGIALIESLMNLTWRYKGRNIKNTVRLRLDERWSHGIGRCGTAFCRDCVHNNECVAEIVKEVKAEIDAEEGGAK